MPELPEVETVRRGLERLIVGRTITDVEIKVPKMIKLDSKVFKQELIGETFSAVKRRGKYLLLELSDKVIISHLRMEGKYLLFPDQVPENKHFHVFFSLDDGSTLVYQDVRKFGTFELVAGSQVDTYFERKKIGPEPTASDFLLAPFREKLANSR